MKKILTLYIFFILYNSFGQEPIKNDNLKSNLQIFTEKTGTLIHKEFFALGSIKRCDIQAVKMVDLTNNSKANGLVFTYDLEKVILDDDEIDGLMKSIDTIQEKFLSTSSPNLAEVVYMSRGGFKFGATSEKGNWTIFIDLNRFSRGFSFSLSKDELSQLISLLEYGKEKLK